MRLYLTNEQAEVLTDLALEERMEIRSSIQYMSDSEREQAIKDYDTLAEIFNLEKWDEDMNESHKQSDELTTEENS